MPPRPADDMVDVEGLTLCLLAGGLLALQALCSLEQDRLSQAACNGAQTDVEVTHTIISTLLSRQWL